MKQQNKSGGGIFSRKEDFIKLLSKAKSSESELIHTYKKHVKASIKHAKATEKHTSNLAALDQIMPDGFDSFLNVFNRTVSPDIRIKKKTDMSSPLLLKNYDLKNVADKDDLVRDHLWHQCHYVLKTKFAPQDSVLVTKLNIADHNSSTFTMAITGVTFGKDNRRSIRHTNYVADLAHIRQNLTEIIANIKKDVMEQVIQEKVFSAPEDIDPIAPGAGTPKYKKRDDPVPDVYGVKAYLDKPAIQKAEPKFGDNRPVFGQEKPKFGQPDYLQKTPIGEASPDGPPVAPPNEQFKKQHERPQFGNDKPQFGNFGKSRSFKKPRRSGDRKFSNRRRNSGNRGNRGNSGNRGQRKHQRPDFKNRNRSRRGSNRFNKRGSRGSRGSRRNRNRGPPPPPDNFD